MKKVHLEQIIRIAKAHQLEDPFASIGSLERFLQFWWCRKFNKPLKDPVLLSYTIDELAYEFFRYFYNEPENDPRKEIKAAKETTEDEEWVKRQLAEIKAAQEESQKILAEAKKNLERAEADKEEGISIKFDE